ncbi:MAG: patatin-like phospholipase family protein [Candidatus Heimdallarchaeaceae archaeon]
MTKVSKEEVQYLAFEGGGGKGITYLGALQALEELDIITHVTEKKGDLAFIRLDSNKIKGIAGTSVGSISALLIACGYTSTEIQKILIAHIGKNILDTVEFGCFPTIYTKKNPNCSVKDPRFEDIEKYMKNSWIDYIQSDEKSFKGFLDIPRKSLKNISYQFFALLLKGYLNFEVKKYKSKPHLDKNHRLSVQGMIKSETPVTAASTILKEPLHSLNSLKYQYGFFQGAKARQIFDEFIENKSGIKNCTFKQFAKEFNIDLVITAVCLNTREAYYFRNRGKWKDLCVADAVRMSISIPYLFKPVLFEETDKKIKSFSGNFQSTSFMVDGGVVDNFPVHAFDQLNLGELNKHVLGFMLVPASKTKPSEILTFTDFTENTFYTLLKNSTRLQFRFPSERDQTITLDSGDLKLFDFIYEQFPEEIISKSRSKTLEYFNDI